MTPPTPPTGVPTTPAPGRGATHANGSHVVTVRDPAGSLAAALHCLAPIGDVHCLLPPGHTGSHLALPVPWPRKEITRDNPAYSRRTA